MTQPTRLDRHAINGCSSCDGNGMIEVAPADQFHHETLARCPHSAMRIIEIKREVEAQRAADAARYANRTLPGTQTEAAS
ncbi:hypothetical protein AB0K45_09645 [Micrococcus luteus]|uniref:hypothetical protein n=1 Tax=Micrococcus luteus TaxID=1270 RepID=UPI003418AE3D